MGDKRIFFFIWLETVVFKLYVQLIYNDNKKEEECTIFKNQGHYLATQAKMSFSSRATDSLTMGPLTLHDPCDAQTSDIWVWF